MVRLASTRSENGVKQNAFAPANRLINENHLKELRFNFAYNLLQTNLDLNVTLERFFENLQDFVQTSGMLYIHESSSSEIQFGKLSAHTAVYNIAAEETNLGRITFSRTKRFAATELAALEMMIGVLFFPLRNALQYRQAIESSMRDNLTGIGNRNALEENFDREIKLAKRHDRPLTLLMIDVDHFKNVNDTVGHLNGDKTLQQIVKSTQQTLRETDQVFRYGGEEFVAILHNTGLHEAKVIAERIRVNVAISPIQLEDQELFCTVSIGVNCFNGEDTSEQLLSKADAALYQAKNAGRNRVEVWHASK